MKVTALIADDERLSRDRLRRFLKCEPEVELVAECATGLEAIEAINQTNPDIVFLDIRMPDVDGFGVLNALKQRSPAIVFVTAFDAFALKAFDVNAIDYLLKPYDQERFKTALARARQWLSSTSAQTKSQQLAELLRFMEARRTEPTSKRLAVRTDNRLVLLSSDEVDWISAAANCAELHVGEKVHRWRGSLDSVLENLPPGQFIRISRFAIVNLDRVRQISPKSHGDAIVILANGAELLCSRRFRTEVELKLNQMPSA